MDKRSDEALQAFLPPPGRHYVRSFLFVRRISTPFAGLHLIARFLLTLSLSAALLRTISTTHPDLLGAGIGCLAALLIFWFSGVSPRVARLYFLLMLPTLVALLLTWLVFNPVPGKVTLFRQIVYTGQLTLVLTPWQAVFVLIVGGYFLWTRRLLLGVLLALLMTIGLIAWVPLPTLQLAHVAFFHPLTVLVSDQNILVAVTKVIGYAGMIMLSLALVISTRDAEFIGALRQLHIPPVIIFFLSTVFRSLDLALSDYETIRQAQLARAIAVRPRSFLRRLRDLASIAVPMVALMLRRSSDIGDALLARGYTLGRATSDFYEGSSWRFIDWLVVALSLCLMYFALGPHPEVATLFWKIR